MARDTFSFFRATGWLLPRAPSRHVTAQTERLAIVGDPHPENVGTFLTPRGERVIDFNDFDLAGYGRYVDDLRRLALGLWIVGDMADLGRKQRGRVVRDVVGGYAAELNALARGAPAVALRAETAFGGDLEAILVRPEPREEEPDEEAPATAEEAALVRALLAVYPATLVAPAAHPRGAFAPKRIARRSLGVTSFPTLRFRVTVEGPTEAAEDDWTLELKESRGTPAAQIVAIQRQMQEHPDDDPLLGFAAAGGREFRVRRASAEQRRLDARQLVKLVKSPRWKGRELGALGQDLGRLLARGHARARDEAGRPGLAALVAAVGDGRALREETADYVAREAARTEVDLDHFRALLETRGAVLTGTPAPRAPRPTGSPPR
jgi:hypothetical protein